MKRSILSLSTVVNWQIFCHCKADRRIGFQTFCEFCLRCIVQTTRWQTDDIVLFTADQTPTPSKFLRNCEEMGLFHELSKNPFEEAFKKASEENKTLELHEVSLVSESFVYWLSRSWTE